MVEIIDKIKELFKSGDEMKDEQFLKILEQTINNLLKIRKECQERFPQESSVLTFSALNRGKLSLEAIYSKMKKECFGHWSEFQELKDCYKCPIEEKCIKIENS